MMTASYSAEDNKLRLYSYSRLSAEDYATVKAAGFRWAPKQELFVAPMWTPEREDLLLDLCGEIDDEDYSPQERAADRAERFGDYRDRRAAEAGAGADTFEAGPSAFGHQSHARAERQARRHDRHRTYAVSQWSKAEYWQERTTAVIKHALYKSSAAVRRSRILRLEAEQRKQAKGLDDYAKRHALWQKAATLDGLDAPVVKATPPYFGVNQAACTPAGRLVYALANNGNCWGEYTHPRNPDRKTSLYSLLTDDTDPITPREAVALWLDGKSAPDDPGSRTGRWAMHYANRLTYERAMLAAEGGSAAEADMVPGGCIGGRQIHKVNRSPATGRVVSVTLKIDGDRWGNTHQGHHMRAFNIERLPEGSYRAPTAEELAAFQAATLERKAEAKAGKPKTPALVNPTDEDARRLQDLWNARAKARHEAARRWATFTPSEVLRVTQAVYSQNSKGDYALCETRTLHACGKPARRSSNLYSSDGAAYDKTLGATVAKIRVKGGGFSPDRVIVLTDKPQKPLPLDWDNLDAPPPAVIVATPEPATV